MIADQESLKQRLTDWFSAEEEAQRGALWKEMTAGLAPEALEQGIFAFVSGLAESARKKQALAEEQQTLLNKWQKDSEEAANAMQATRDSIAATKQELATAEKRMRGYESQFASLQRAAEEAQQGRKALADELTTAWAQFKDREEQLDAAHRETGEVRGQLVEMTQIKESLTKELAQAWEQFRDREEKLDIEQKELLDTREQLAVSRQETEDARREIQAKTEELAQAWDQFKDRDEKLAATAALLSETQADRDTAWAQFKDRDHQLEELRKEIAGVRKQLSEAKAYGAEMAMKAGEMEQLFAVKLHKKLHRG